MQHRLSYENARQLQEKARRLIARLCELFDIIGIYYNANEDLSIDTLYHINTVDIIEDPDNIYRSTAVRGHIIEALYSAQGACSHIRLLFSRGGLTDYHCRQALMPMMERNIAVLQANVRYLEDEAKKAEQRTKSG